MGELVSRGLAVLAFSQIVARALLLPSNIAVRVLYLHGFASGPSSRKAVFFRQRLEAAGIPLEAPALDEGDFAGLTVSSQLGVCERLLHGDTAVLIGSSLGGYVAALYAARHAEVKGLVLLAPAFSFCSLWEKELGREQLAEWKQKGALSVFHYASGCARSVGYGLLEDAQRYEPYPEVRQPCLLFHGNQDESVPVMESVRFADSHPNVMLVRLESGHELTDVLEVIWTSAEKFLMHLIGQS